MRTRYEFKGKAKTYTAIGGLAIIVWMLFGQTFFSFNLGVFNRGFQMSFFRAGHFEKHGVYWRQHGVTLGHIVSTGGESLDIHLDARIARGTLVIYAWRWPAFLHDEPMLGRFRFNKETDGRFGVDLPEPGIYVLSATGLRMRGDIDVDWHVAAPGAAR